MNILPLTPRRRSRREVAAAAGATCGQVEHGEDVGPVARGSAGVHGVRDDPSGDRPRLIQQADRVQVRALGRLLEHIAEDGVRLVLQLVGILAQTRCAPDDRLA